VPGYINHPKLKDAGKVFVIAVNDPFVYVLPLHRSLLVLSFGNLGALEYTHWWICSIAVALSVSFGGPLSAYELS
jgi:hypothetical protein